ncbi:carnosic acid synthase-like [Aristolochia californica]|uniref:carnosic acid synthase-like n=1 Tax=Aristolochia californica TaxID=171875 RepID=UPI0035E06381
MTEINSTRPPIISMIIEGYARWWGEDRRLVETESTIALRKAFVALLVGTWFFVVVNKWKKDRLRLPPGPPGLPLVGNLPFLDRNLHQHLAELARTYGPIFRLRLGLKLCIVVSTSSLAKELLKDHDAIFANHDVPSSALVLPNGLHGIAWAPHGQQWRLLRKLAVGEMLSNTRLDYFHGVRKQEIEQMVRRIYANTRAPLVIRDMLFTTLFDVLTGMLWGRTLKEAGMQETGEEFREVVHQILGSFGQLSISDFFPFLAPFDLQGLERRRKKIAARLHQILDSIIVMKKDAGSCESKEFLQVLLRMEKRGDPAAPLTRDQIKGLIMDLVMAGMDTTAVTSEWVMSELIVHQDIMKKIQQELDQEVGSDSVVEEHHLSRLRYLKAVVKEAMRLHPAAPLMLPRTPSETCTLGGYSVPRGTRVLVNLWAINRDPEVWENPTEFNPERFLTGDRKWDFTGNDFHFFPFGSGRRICPGAPFADRMLMYGLATLLHSFDWQLPEGAELDLKEKFGMVLKKAEPLVLVPKPRLPEAVLCHHYQLEK